MPNYLLALCPDFFVVILSYHRVATTSYMVNTEDPNQMREIMYRVSQKKTHFQNATERPRVKNPQWS